MMMFPDISPIAFQIGPLAIHWYGIMYLLGFSATYFLALRRRAILGLSQDAISDLIFYGALGVILGGRIGYMLFYNFPTLIHHPLSIFKIWEGGMSFHGGLLGVILALYLFAKKFKLKFLALTDFIAPFVPIGLGLGRLGNFINGELWGRVTTMPWGVVFPMADDSPRHPSQLYEFALEGVLLFIVLWQFTKKPRLTGQVSSLFLIMYACIRMFVELFREPDSQLGFILMHSITMGQLLSFIMLIAGIIIWKKAK